MTFLFVRDPSWSLFMCVCGGGGTRVDAFMRVCVCVCVCVPVKSPLVLDAVSPSLCSSIFKFVSPLVHLSACLSVGLTECLFFCLCWCGC